MTRAQIVTPTLMYHHYMHLDRIIISLLEEVGNMDDNFRRALRLYASYNEDLMRMSFMHPHEVQYLIYQSYHFFVYMRLQEARERLNEAMRLLDTAASS